MIAVQEAGTPKVFFAGSPLDRADHIRSDSAALEGLMDWRARLLKLDTLMPRVGDDGNLVWGTLADSPDDAELVFLGLLDNKACFAAVPEAGEARPFDPRALQMLGMLTPRDLALYGGARSLVDWHARHRYCAQCGHATKPAKGGWQRNCSNCDAQHFPRTDPVAIMLVEHDGRLLLGRQPRFPPKRFSALAGFVEPGETLEEAVAREVFEEAGVRVRDVMYVASQPWPFPSQLMLGCHATADDDALTIDKTELDEADWFTRAEIEQALRDGDHSETIILPPEFAIARTLIDWWVKR